MIDCIIHIYNEVESMDEQVQVKLQLPCLIPIGTIFYLSDESIKSLEKQAKSDIKIAKRYINWYYGESFGIHKIKKANIPDLSFKDAFLVSSILYKENGNEVHIELTN